MVFRFNLSIAGSFAVVCGRKAETINAGGSHASVAIQCSSIPYQILYNWLPTALFYCDMVVATLVNIEYTKENYIQSNLLFIVEYNAV